MKSMTVGFAALVVLLAACKDNKASDEGGDKPAEPGDTAGKSGQPTPEPAEPEPAPEPEPAAPAITALELKDIGGRDKPLVIQVPEGTEVQMLDVDADEMLPWAKLQAGPLEISVSMPEVGMIGIEDEKGMTSRSDKDAKFVHEAKTDAGWELIVERDGKFDVSVQHTRLKIACGSGELPDRASADKILEICKTITEK